MRVSINSNIIRSLYLVGLETTDAVGRTIWSRR